MDGFQFCRNVKRDDQLKKIPFVFYTATYTDARDEELSLKLGARQIYSKTHGAGSVCRDHQRSA